MIGVRAYTLDSNDSHGDKPISMNYVITELKTAMGKKERSQIVFIGDTGDGKTSLLNLLGQLN